MSEQNKRRAFLKTIAVGGVGAAVAPSTLLQAREPATKAAEAKPPVTTSNYTAPKRDKYNSPYTGENLSRLAFPIGGIGAGMFCLEGTGA
ncbi:MAG TPA: twin-arginine translocation signal domain-containing protein, partial [Flavitalea sp.]|nr:twin-arginine translocation signal domain-containing protein [Flavitalea sp.]